MGDEQRARVSAARAAAREAHSLITRAELDLETRLKVGSALEALQDLIALGNTPTAQEGVLDTWHAKRARIVEILTTRRARSS